MKRHKLLYQSSQKQRAQAAVEYFLIAAITAVAAIFLLGQLQTINDAWNDEVNDIEENPPSGGPGGNAIPI